MILSRVKNPCLILLLSLVSLISFGQSPGSRITINWKNPAKILDTLGNERNALVFEKAIYLGEYHYLPAYRFSIPGNVTDFKIINPVYEALTSDEQTIVNNANIFTLTPKIDVKYLNGRPVSNIYIVPLNAGPGGISDKMLSFEYSFERTFNTPAPNNNRKISGNGKSLRLTASANTSVLSAGSWYKISIPKSGIFKIDYDLLKNMGIDVDNIDPTDIKIYGNGGGMLPQNNSAFRHDDLVENAIHVEGETDGIFDSGDYILFYGQGPDTWAYNSSKGRFLHTKNIYSDLAYYFITIGPGNGLRVQDQASVAGSYPAITTFDERLFHELENENLLHSGREWYGESFNFTTTQNFSFSVPGITSNTTLKLHSSVLGRSLLTSNFNISINNQNLGTQIFTAIAAGSYPLAGDTDTATFSINTNLIPGSILTATLTYNKGSYSSATAYLNFLEINVKRDLKLYGSQTAFRSVESANQPISEFLVNSAVATMKIWDITNPLVPKNQQYSLTGSEAAFSIVTDTIREFIAFNGSTFDAPVYVGPVTNQNLHSITSPGLPDLVIVTHPSFLSSAYRLAQFKNAHDNLDVEVVTTEQVYNEFSSGAQDISAIRDFVKMLYDRKSGSDSIRYLLLFGDCSYDYKNRLGGNTNFVPVYESRISLHPINSHSSDDYYGFMDDGSGDWIETGAGDDTLRIGIGRLTVKNISEAEAVVNKIIHYSSSLQTQGKWRNKITFFADDGDGNLHLNDANNLSNTIKVDHPNYNINKIFMDAYPQVSAPGGETCPMAKEAITQSIEKGTFVLNYTGHGGKSILAQESLVDLGQINNWENYDALTFFITATCEFGCYDDPSLVSGAEHALLNSKGGAIALITSTRPVYSNTNLELNTAIYDCMFDPIGGTMPRLGDIIRLTKNNSLSGINNRNYALLGDPSLMLAYPREDVVVTKINGTVVSLNDTLKALSTATIEGEVRDGSGLKINDFNGSIQITVYDKESTIQTMGTQGSSSTTFKIMNNLIYEGSATVTNGSFSVSFVIPKDISYLFDKGKISLYSKKDNSPLDAQGYNTDIIIGGSDTNFVADNIPPQIKLYMNDESFVFGGLTAKNSLFLAKLTDDNGINIAGQGIGHEITGNLDNSDEVIILNEYYSAKKDTYKEGLVEFPFKDLSIGNHSIKFKCWDTHNNSSEAYLEFVVANDTKIALDHVLNYPNPFSTHTTFHFDHNRAGDDLDIMIQIFTISGKLIKTLDNRTLSSQAHISDIVWDGRDDFGDKIGKGVYVYKVNVRSLRDASQVFKYQKLVILN